MNAQAMLNPRRNSALNQIATESTARGSWPVTIGLIAMFAAGIALATPVVTTNGWYLPTLMTAAVALVVAQAIRQLTGNGALAILGGFVGMCIALVVVASPAELTDAIVIVGIRLAEFAQQLASDQPPFRESVAVTTALAAASGILALIADAFALTWQRTLLAPLAVLPYAIAPTVLGLPAAPFWQWIAMAAALVVLLYLGNRFIQRGDDEARTALGFTADGRRFGGVTGALTMGAASLASIALVAAFLPPSSGALWNVIGGGQALSTTRVNPIIDLGDDLRRGTPTEVLRYATSIPEGKLPYLSLTTLTELNAGSEWQPAEFQGTPISGTGTLPRPQSIERATNLQAVNYHIVMDSGVSPYLPKIGVPTSVTGVTGNYSRDERSGDIREQQEEALAQSFQSESVLALPSNEEIAAATAEVPEELRPYLELPDEPAIDKIRDTVNEIVDPNATPFQQALQLQQWMTGGAFTYSEYAPVSGGYDGTSLDVVAKFLDYRSGYCVHFASAMAVMSRLLNIPSRIQVGFTPGTPQSVNDLGQTVYAVTTDDLHAWTEVWLPGYGWVPLESTPNSGLNLQEVAPAPDAPPTETAVAPTPTPTPTPSPIEESAPPTGEASTDPTVAPTATPDAEAIEPELLRWLGIVAAVLAGIALLALVVCIPAMLRGATRRSRKGAVTSGGSTQRAATAAWEEIIDTARDLGANVSRTGTRGRQLSSLAHAFEWATEDEHYLVAERLADTYDAAWFGDPDRPIDQEISWDDVEFLRSAMVEWVSPSSRRRARWLPVSLRERAADRRGQRAASRPPLRSLTRDTR